MNNLAVLDKNNTLNSREVAEMVEKRHSDLLR
ncbi:Rha family transcriptional regulator, partial [Listeria monocytogenes]|nr:Rha family transcriptional regulator [Listeria monocytogenes]